MVFTAWSSPVQSSAPPRLFFDGIKACIRDHAINGTAIRPSATKYRFAALGKVSPIPAKRGFVASSPCSRVFQHMEIHDMEIHGMVFTGAASVTSNRLTPSIAARARMRGLMSDFHTL